MHFYTTEILLHGEFYNITDIVCLDECTLKARIEKHIK